MTTPSPRQRFVLANVFGLALVVVVGLFYAFVLGSGKAATADVPARSKARSHVLVKADSGKVLAGFEARSYAPGEVAALRITGDAPRTVTLCFFLAGAAGADVPGLTNMDWDKHTFGKELGDPLVIHRPASKNWVEHVHLGARWPSGAYVARLEWNGGEDYAPFILRAKQPGTAPVLVIEPTNTWHAYNVYNGDSWYLDGGVHVVDLTHPFAATDVKGRHVPAGLPEQFWRLDVGFLRWYWRSGYQGDFFSDDDLEHITDVKQLLRYRLIVFAGHEEYVTSHVYKLITQYRDAGGNLAFLSANNFFYKVEVHGNTMVGRWHWRKLGKPEASLIGAQYVGWNNAHWPNQPYHLINRQAAPWLFKGTGLQNGATFGKYGIEIDEPNTYSPDDTDVLAEIPNEFGDKDADMTIYRMGRSTVFDAGVFNFAASAHWPKISRMVSNLWGHLSGETPG
ncbi:MAG: hypothetical protein QOG85_1753 [Gaiellaceae bacterium]|jgi:hypothetical protein|nr:hypothetical protein [Gaiellaceae bacterium]